MEIFFWKLYALSGQGESRAPGGTASAGSLCAFRQQRAGSVPLAGPLVRAVCMCPPRTFRAGPGPSGELLWLECLCPLGPVEVGPPTRWVQFQYAQSRLLSASGVSGFAVCALPALHGQGLVSAVGLRTTPGSQDGSGDLLHTPEACR